MGNLLYLFVVIGTMIASMHFQVSSGLEWTSSSLPDGSRVEACVGETASFRWEYTASGDETVTHIEYYKITQEGKRMLATYWAGHLLKLPAVTMTVAFLPNAGVEIGNFTWDDFTVYHITINYRRGGLFLSASRSVTLALPDTPVLVANRLVASIQPEPVTDVTTGQRHVQLSCGQFLNLGGRQISVIWRTPSGARVPSTSNTNGTFHLTLPNPVVGGTYKCQLKDSSLAARCVKNLSILKRGSHVHVDKVDARLMLFKSRDERLTSEVGRLQERVELQEETCTRVATDISSLREDVSTVDTQQASDITSLREDMRSLREDLKNQGDDVTSLREDMTSLRENLKNQGDDVTSLRQDITSLREDLKNQGDDVTSLREDMRSLREDLKNQGDDVTSLREDMTSLREDLKNQGSSLQAGLSLCENAASKQTQEMDKLRSELHVLKDLKETVSNLQSAFQTFVDDAKLEFKSLVEEVKSTCTSDVDNLQQQVSDIRDIVLNVTNDLEKDQDQERTKMKTPASCVDVREYDTSNNIYTLTVNNRNITVFCDQQTAGGGWTVIQRRIDGSLSFDRNWTDYEEGFGDLRGEFWLGLSNIHRLTSSDNYSLRVDLTDWDNTTAYALYDTFYIDGPDQNYTLHVAGYSGTAGDSLIVSSGRSDRIHNNQPFSTPDRDHDNYSGNCAGGGHSGWWYNMCHIAHLNGLYGKSGSTYEPQLINWFSWHYDYRSYKHAGMMIRPRN